MKVIIKTTLCLLPMFFASCLSVNALSSDDSGDKASNQIENDVKSDNFSQTENSKSKENEKFIKSLENVNLKILSAPKYASAGGKFTSPFQLSVSDSSSQPLAAYSVTVSYPAQKTENGIIFNKKELLTDENGLCSFEPEASALSFSCREEISFYPTPLSDAENVSAAVKAKAVTSEWKVRSDIIRTGAVLFIWEFNERDRPLRNSYEILSGLKGYGIWNVGNAPVNEPSDISKSLETLYKENYDIIENQYGYLICGTIKFLKPVEKLESGTGYSCTLKADISAIRMRDGKLVFSRQYEQYAEGSNWNNVTQSAKSKISEKITDSLIYGL